MFYTFSPLNRCRLRTAKRCTAIADMSAASRPKLAAAAKAKGAATFAVDPSSFLDAALREQLTECALLPQSIRSLSDGVLPRGISHSITFRPYPKPECPHRAHRSGMVDSILPSRKRKQSVPAVVAAPPLTKAERKKLERLAEEKRKKAERAALFATLNTTKISKEEFSVMRSSKAIGQVCKFAL